MAERIIYLYTPDLPSISLSTPNHVYFSPIASFSAQSRIPDFPPSFPLCIIQIVRFHDPSSEIEACRPSRAGNTVNVIESRVGRGEIGKNGTIGKNKNEENISTSRKILLDHWTRSIDSRYPSVVSLQIPNNNHAPLQNTQIAHHRTQGARIRLARSST